MSWLNLRWTGVASVLPAMLAERTIPGGALVPRRLARSAKRRRVPPAACVGLVILLGASGALAQGPGFFPLGIRLGSLNELATLGSEIKAAGFNCVLADGPLGAAVIPGLWQARELGLRVFLSSERLGDLGGGPEAQRDHVQRLFDLVSWTRDHPAYAGLWLNIEGLRPEAAQAYLLAARAGNPHAAVIATAGDRAWWDYTPDQAVVAPMLKRASAPADAVAAVLRPGGNSEEGVGPLGIPSPKEVGLRPVYVASAEHGASAAWLAHVLTSYLNDGAGGFFFAYPQETLDREALWEALKMVRAKLPPAAAQSLEGAERREILAAEAASPLVWTLKRFGEAGLHGLEPYRTPDGSAGYAVTGRALLDLSLPSRSGLVDASELTRFSMRMYSAVEGQGALLALSTGGDISYLRLPLQGGWSVYEVDLSTAVWESAQAEGLKWGGATGVVQALSFTPSPHLGAQIAFDWIRLEPFSEGEVEWKMDTPHEVVKTEGVEGLVFAEGELKGKATASQVSLELALPADGLEVRRLPFLSFLGSLPPAGTGQVEFEALGAKEETSVHGTAVFFWSGLQEAQCLDLRHLCFRGDSGVYWETGHGPVRRLRLTLPAQVGEEFVLDAVRLGPNYDLRAVPSQALPREVSEPEPPTPDVQ